MVVKSTDIWILKRANKDIKYLTEILSDPKKKEQYNASMLSKGFLNQNGIS